MGLFVDFQERQGEVSVITRLGDPSYKLELSSLVPYNGLVSTKFHGFDLFGLFV